MMQHSRTCSNTAANGTTVDQARPHQTTLPEIDAISVAELMDRWPAVVPVFVAHRMACVGCVMSPFDRLDDACRIYGLQTTIFAEEIRRAVEEQP